MAIHQWPEGSRPRERLLAQGARALSDAELLAILLRTGRAGQSALAVATELLAEFGSLRVLFAADCERFCAYPGVGLAKYAELQAVLELGKRHLAEALPKDQALNSPEMTRRFFQAQLRDESRELFAALFLDSQHRVLAFEVLSVGTLDAASVYPREVLKRCLAANAGAVIFAHNHPSGVSEPSQADRRLTERLREALALVDIRVLDHLVIGEGRPVSFAERGWI